MIKFIEVETLYTYNEDDYLITARIYPHHPQRLTADPWNSIPEEGGDVDIINVSGPWCVWFKHLVDVDVKLLEDIKSQIILEIKPRE